MAGTSISRWEDGTKVSVSAHTFDAIGTRPERTVTQVRLEQGEDWFILNIDPRVAERLRHALNAHAHGQTHELTEDAITVRIAEGLTYAESICAACGLAFDGDVVADGMCDSCQVNAERSA